MNVPVPVNPRLLKWARETAGYTVEDVVRKLKRKRITERTIRDWENGAEAPDYIQLERLAYEVYKRPLALFFFPAPPEEETPRQAFRTLPDSEIRLLSKRMRLLLRRAQAMRLNLEELHEGMNPSERPILRNLSFSLDVPAGELADRVRRFLGIGLSRQFEWSDADEAFKSWREALEDSGVFVFKEAFREEGISGFCLHDARFPIIYVNNTTTKTRQIFTLFHELAHLLSGTGGIDSVDDRYVRGLSGRNRGIEVLCNRFAAAFLVPEEDFDARSERMELNENDLISLANQYRVSREVILRLLRDKRRISRSFYENMMERWKDVGKKKRGDGGDYYRTRGAYLGGRYLELAFSRLYQNRISIDQLADYLNVKVRNVPGMEALLYRKGEVG